MNYNQIQTYILIKRYPGSQDVGHITTSLETPAHQWPEFYKEVDGNVRILLERRKRYMSQLAEVNKELKLIGL